MKSLEEIIRGLVQKESQSRIVAAEKERLDQEQEEAQEIRRTLAAQQIIMRAKAVSQKKKMGSQLRNRIANHNALLFTISNAKLQSQLRQIEKFMSGMRSLSQTNPAMAQLDRSYGIDHDEVEKKMKEEATLKANEWLVEQCRKNPDVETLKRVQNENRLYLPE